MSSIDKAGAYTFGHRTVKRMGYGAMQLAGPGVYGPPKDHDAAAEVVGAGGGDVGHGRSPGRM